VRALSLRVAVLGRSSPTSWPLFLTTEFCHSTDEPICLMNESSAFLGGILAADPKPFALHCLPLAVRGYVVTGRVGWGFGGVGGWHRAVGSWRCIHKSTTAAKKFTTAPAARGSRRDLLLLNAWHDIRRLPA